MLTSAEEAELRASLRFRPQDRWLQLLYRRALALHCGGGVKPRLPRSLVQPACKSQDGAIHM